MAKLIVIIFFNWQTAWNLLAKPEQNKQHSNDHNILYYVFCHIIGSLLDTKPDNRMELNEVFEKIGSLKQQLIQNGGFGNIEFSNFSFSVSENTQQSMYLEGEIRQILSSWSTNLTLHQFRITNKIHDQSLTNLCHSFATVTCLRAAIMFYLESLNIDYEVVRTKLDRLEEFRFEKLLCVFTGCISPRSLDGIIINSTYMKVCIKKC